MSEHEQLRSGAGTFSAQANHICEDENLQELWTLAWSALLYDQGLYIPSYLLN